MSGARTAPGAVVEQQRDAPTAPFRATERSAAQSAAASARCRSAQGSALGIGSSSLACLTRLECRPAAASCQHVAGSTASTPSRASACAATVARAAGQRLRIGGQRVGRLDGTWKGVAVGSSGAVSGRSRVISACRRSWPISAGFSAPHRCVRVATARDEAAGRAGLVGTDGPAQRGLIPASEAIRWRRRPVYPVTTLARKEGAR
jgi:hypothetical protein